MLKKLYTDNTRVVLAAIMWGTSGAFIKYLGLSPGLMGFFRVALPVLVFGGLIIYRRERVFGHGIQVVLLASLVNAFRLFFYFIGFLNAPIGNAIIILYSWPIFAVVFSHFFLGEPLPLVNKLMLILAMSGISFVFADKSFHLGNEVVMGMLAMLFSAALNAASVVLFKHQSSKFSSTQIVFFQNFIGALLFLPFLFIGFDQLTVQKTMISSFYAILVGVVGYGLFFLSLKKINASTASFLTYIEVVSAVLFGVLLFNEVLSWNEILGGVIIILASVFLRK